MQKIMINGADAGTSIADAVKKLQAGDVMTIGSGRYSESVRMENINGTADKPVHIKAEAGAVLDGMGGEIALAVVDCAHIIIEGLCVTNAHYGIDVKSTPACGNKTLEHIILRGNEVYGIDGPKGGHAIAVYGENPHAPISGLVIENNRVHNNRLYWSEALVVNGNIDGFVINGNIVWNNDNIGIDIIGFEGKAGDNPDVDCARNGEVFDNIVFGSNTTGNEAYWSGNHNPEGWDGERREKNAFGGEYDRCCGGIYVDGGWHIEIFHNFVFDNDLGIEVATEHKPPLVTKDVHVHDNIIAGSNGWAGLIFGGYASHLGFTTECTFKNNILYDNESSVAVQKSKGNVLKNNVIVGGWAALDFNGEMQENNLFEENYWENTNNDDEYFEQLDELPTNQRDKQVKGKNLLKNPASGDFTLSNLPAEAGTQWRPDGKWLKLYAEFLKAQQKADEAVEYLQSKTFPAPADGESPCTHITQLLNDGGFAGVSAKRLLKQSKDKYMVQLAAQYGENIYAQATTKEGVHMA
ncbi:MAG: hypothetical protein FWC16_05535 [Defluviitaleaceae bacterium]|nr:hypothetical protein [Defluviitaleaceae bacterium]MCL2274371.1 hypothetical protein [Defluviitaleaceae bacterium]